MYVNIHVITVHSIMLCYPIIINVSNIKENTYTYIHTHKHMHTHVNTHTFMQIVITT